jgi:hypothetical protein
MFVRPPGRGKDVVETKVPVTFISLPIAKWRTYTQETKVPVTFVFRPPAITGHPEIGVISVLFFGFQGLLFPAPQSTICASCSPRSSIGRMDWFLLSPAQGDFT